MEELKEKLELHRLWLEDSTKGTKLDLSGANLRYANLSEVDLRYVNLSDADLSDAHLSDANLSDVDLSDANLSGADLRYANLSDADLRCANLRYADLSGANLINADLSDADLSDANLRYCIGNNIEVKSIQIGTYLVSYTKDILNIGCQSHTHLKWKSFCDNDILSMDGKRALDWWSLYKHIIFELIDRK